MKGVAFGVSPKLAQYDLTHEIPAYYIWTAAYRLRQTIPFWPAGTVVVSVVDRLMGLIMFHIIYVRFILTIKL